MIRVARWLAGLLLLSVTVISPGRCLAHLAAGPLTLTICTADGLRTIALTEDGSAPTAETEACVACHALPSGPVAWTPALPSTAWIAAPPVGLLVAASGWLPAIRGPPSGSRAPPSTV